MSVDEAARHELYSTLKDALGPGPTNTLMSYLPPTGWSDVATTQTTALLGAELRAEISDVRTEIETLRGEFGELRGEFGVLRGEFGELRGEFGELQGEFEALRGEFGQLRGEFGEFKSDVRGEFAELRAWVSDSLRQQTYVMVGTTITIAGAVAAAATLL